MYSKKKNIVYIIGIITVMLVLLIMVIRKEKEPQDGMLESNVTTTISASGEETTKSADDILRAEAKAFYDKEYEAGTRIVKGTYKDRRDSYEINEDFITEDYLFRNPTSFIEFEFIGYEELEDLTEYAELINWNRVNPIYEKRNLINKDGTLNTFDYILKVRYADSDYGEEALRQETKFVPVKLTVRYKNLLTESTNDLTITKEHNIATFQYMDDGKFYEKDSIYLIYRYNIGHDEPIYVSIPPERRKLNSAAYVLQPGEEIVADLIYMIPECELNNAYFETRWGSTDVRNFNSIGSKLIPIYNLKKLEDK